MIDSGDLDVPNGAPDALLFEHLLTWMDKIMAAYSKKDDEFC